MSNKIISICGSHGVGKTTVIEELKMKFPNYLYISESTRKIMPEIGFDNPYKFVDEYGISFYESIIIGQWAILPQVEEMPYHRIVLDRSPLDNLAYYYLLRKEEEKKYEMILTNLCQFFCKFIDLYLFVPAGVFELIPDSMQIVETQLELEKIIKYLFRKFEIEYQIITEKGINGRVKEIEELVKGV